MENEKLIIDAVTVLANKLGTTGDHLWGVLVRQAPISSIISLSFFTIGLLMAIIGWRTLFNLAKMIDKPNIDRELLAAAVAIVAIFSFLMSLIILFNIDSVSMWISGLFNPEYWALQQVVHSFR
jgi:hypothetical protein